MKEITVLLKFPRSL